MHFSTLLTCAALARLSIAGYVLEDDYNSENFFSMFEFFTGTDPTHGFVQYVDASTATSSNLTSISNGNVYMGVDSTNEAPNGRSSVRITSTKSYDSGLVILDLAHMPTGCGTWPAFWMVGPSWPSNGEIDIIEGVNEQVGNAMTLHTGPGCSITNGGGFSGSITTDNCDVNAAGQSTNAGCQIFDSQSNAYGDGLNSNGGGVFATEWTSSAISIFFFPHGSVPADIASGSPDPTGWGKPAAQFSGACDIATTFNSQQIVFDTTFCGDWAGAVWSSGSCASKASTCNSFVQNNPSAFTDAYWSINSLKVYQQGADQPSKHLSISSAQSSAVVSISVAPSSALSLPISIPAASSVPLSLPFSFSTPSHVQTTFAISTKASTSTKFPTSFPTLSLSKPSGIETPSGVFPTGAFPSGAFPSGSGLFPTGTGAFASGTGAPFHHHHHHHNGTNGTFHSGTGSRKTVHKTVRLTQTVENPGNVVSATGAPSVVVSSAVTTAAPASTEVIDSPNNPLAYTKLKHNPEPPVSKRGESEVSEKAARRRARHLRDLKERRHGSV